MSENRQEHSEELTELQEAVEMATLDKEMAEERVIINDLLVKEYKSSSKAVLQIFSSYSSDL